MDYDINNCHFSGKVENFRELNTRPGIAMYSFNIKCWKETIRCVAVREVANTILSEVNDGDRIEARGRIQSSNWEKDGSRFFSYQKGLDLNEWLG
jgi:single-stranded DNA-binding protein